MERSNLSSTPSDRIVVNDPKRKKRERERERERERVIERERGRERETGRERERYCRPVCSVSQFTLAYGHCFAF